jgi:hypothetical protein
MQTITITSEKDRRFTASIDGKVVGTLLYPKWYSQDAEIMIGSSAYSIKPRGFWKMGSEVLKDGKPIFEVANKWRGTQISRAKEPHHFYTLKLKGWFKNGYILESYKGEEILEIRHDFSWKKFNSGYTVVLNDAIAGEDGLILVLVAMHFYRAAMNAAAAGVVS